MHGREGEEFVDSQITLLYENKMEVHVHYLKFPSLIKCRYSCMVSSRWKCMCTV